MRFQVNESEAGQRLDRLLRDRLTSFGRSSAKRLIEEGAVFVDQKRAKKNWLLKLNQWVEIKDEFLDQQGTLEDAPLLSELKIVDESDDLIALDKPPGLPSASIRGKASASVAGWLNLKYPQMKEIGFGELDAGLIHRLDTFTSGLLIAAKTQLAFQALSAALKEHQLTKTYLALSTHRPESDEGVIRTGLQARGKGRVRILPDEKSKCFESRYRLLGSAQSLHHGKELYLIQVKAEAAYRHQVRAHLSLIGAPLYGDELYGGEPSPLSPRHALACTALSGVLNLKGEQEIQLETELAADLAELAHFDELLKPDAC